MINLKNVTNSYKHTTVSILNGPFQFGFENVNESVFLQWIQLLTMYLLFEPRIMKSSSYYHIYTYSETSNIFQ